MLQTGYNHSCHHPSPHKIPEEEVKANPAALHNSKFKKEQRAKMLKGIRPDECGYCWNIEDLGKDYLVKFNEGSVAALCVCFSCLLYF